MNLIHSNNVVYDTCPASILTSVWFFRKTMVRSLFRCYIPLCVDLMHSWERSRRLVIPVFVLFMVWFELLCYFSILTFNINFVKSLVPSLADSTGFFSYLFLKNTQSCTMKIDISTFKICTVIEDASSIDTQRKMRSENFIYCLGQE